MYTMSHSHTHLAKISIILHFTMGKLRFREMSCHRVAQQIIGAALTKSMCLTVTVAQMQMTFNFAIGL